VWLRARAAASPARRSPAQDNVVITLTHAGELLAEAKLVLEVYDNLQEHTIPFKIGNFDLLGRPMK
jgi:hypothetical protein